MPPLVPARLGFLEGTPFSETYGDVYHSAAGGPAQARHVFLRGNELPARWAGRERFVILETGFGAGINFLATWQAWRRDPARCGRLHFVSIEKHPFVLFDLRDFLRRYPELQPEASELEAGWPMLVPGAHRLEFDGGKVVLTLFFSDVKVTRELRLAADAFYLDGFAPARNPDMWTPAIMRNLSRLAAPGATAASWSVAAEVRKALQETGFAVDKRPGFGGKREMLVAQHQKQHQKQGRTTFIPRRSATVVGAGLAGAAVCERLCARGWDVTLYERHAAPAQEASGNHAGTFHPIVTPDDSIFARLTRSAFLHSISCWKKLAELRWDSCGVLQLARDEKEAVSQRKALAALGLPAEYAQYATQEEAGAHAGVPLPASGIWFPSGGWIQPRSLVQAQLAACGRRLERRFSVEVKHLTDEGPVILANSFDAGKLHPVPRLRLRRVRGQLTYVPAGEIEPPHVVVLRGGMVLPPVDGLCVVGATYDIDDEDPSPRSESHESNVQRMARILDVSSISGSFEGRVAFRAVTPDRVPVVGKLGAGVYGAFAYGSRGLIWAALAAELLAAELEGEPLPLEGKLVAAMDPARFARRAALRQPGGSPG